MSVLMSYMSAGAPERIWKWGGAPVRSESWSTDPARSDWKNFLFVPLHFLALKAQLVVLVSAFVMVSTVWSASCLLFFYCPRVQSFVKVGARAPVPYGVGATACLYQSSFHVSFASVNYILILAVWLTAPTRRHMFLASLYQWTLPYLHWFTNFPVFGRTGYNVSPIYMTQFTWNERLVSGYTLLNKYCSCDGISVVKRLWRVLANPLRIRLD